jgi:hypothetical protein
MLALSEHLVSFPAFVGVRVVHDIAFMLALLLFLCCPFTRMGLRICALCARLTKHL